ncbi:transposase [Symmachiella dynata]|uniref:transposase n=1 Tax=Symmachiella dynata TaxID=2527995 RepID=UPI0011A8018A
MATSRAKYDTDLADELWQLIHKHLPNARKCGPPRTIVRREITHAILYINRTGCARRMFIATQTPV